MFNAKASLKLLNPGKVAIEEADKNPSIKLQKKQAGNKHNQFKFSSQ